MAENHETWHGVCNNFLAELGQALCKPLANRSFPQEGSWFREETCHLRLRNNICTLPSLALIFYTARLDQI